MCHMPPAHTDIGSILDFLWSRVKLAFLLTITCVLDVQMGYASPFSTSTFKYLSNDIMNSSRQWLLTLAITLEDSGVHWDSNSQNGSSLGSVSVHPHTLPHSRASLLACVLPSPCFGQEPKARVATYFNSHHNFQVKITENGVSVA